MGVYSPARSVTDAVHERVMREVSSRWSRASQRRHPLSGLLYAGLMIEDGMPRVLEFNARFGDPESSVG